MKKFLKLGAILIIISMVTGCVKMEINMGINKDKSMDLQIVQAFEKSLVEQDSSILDTNDFKEAENQGFLVRDYNDGKMVGYTFTKKFNNIDSISTEENNYISNFGDILEKPDVYVFSVKKGFFKNTYTAKLNVSDSGMGGDFDSLLGNNSSFDDTTSYEDDFSTSDEFISGDDWSSLGGNMDPQMMANMEMNFVVNVPYKAVESNATTINNDGKELTWNLLLVEDKTLDFKFDLYNMTNIYIVVGIGLAVIVLIIVFIVKKIGKNNSNSNKKYSVNTNSNPVNSFNTYTSTVDNGTNKNSFINLDTSFSSDQSTSNNFIDFDTASNENINNNSFISSNVNQSSNVDITNSNVNQNYNFDAINPNPTSNNSFFNPEELNTSVQAQQSMNVTSSFSTSGVPLDQLSQFNNSSYDASVNNFQSNMQMDSENDVSSILNNLNSVSFNSSNQSTNPEVNIQPTVNQLQNEQINNKFFQDPNNYN